MHKVIRTISFAAAALIGSMSANAASVYLGDLSGTTTSHAVTANGPFTDFFNFTVKVASFSGLAAASVSFSSYGAVVGTLGLYEGVITDAAELVGKASISGLTQTTSTNSNGALITTLSGSSLLNPGSPYTLVTGGESKGVAAYSTIIALVDSTRVVSPVPEPETYAMLLAGLGMMGFIARRRQKNR